MKKNFVIAGAVALSLLISPVAYAEEAEVADESIEETVPDPIEDPRDFPNTDTLPLPSEELVEQNPWVNSSVDPEPNNDQVNPSSQNEPESWAVVDENGNTVNIIVCDIDYCGSGWIPTRYDGFTPVEFARVVLQSARNPQNGQNNGGHGGQYNFPSGIWTEERGDGGTYQIPVEYGQEPFCILNCPVPEEVVDNPEVPLDPAISTENVETLIDVDSRSFNVSPILKKREISFTKKFPMRKNIKWKSVWVIATSNDDKVVWKIRVAKKGKTKITLPAKYLDWNISVNYTLVNNKKSSSKLFFV